MESRTDSAVIVGVILAVLAYARLHRKLDDIAEKCDGLWNSGYASGVTRREQSRVRPMIGQTHGRI